MINARKQKIYKKIIKDFFHLNIFIALEKLNFSNAKASSTLEWSEDINQDEKSTLLSQLGVVCSD